MLRMQDTPATNKYLLEGALAGGPNNGAASFGPASWNQASCECVAAPPDTSTMSSATRRMSVSYSRVDTRELDPSCGPAIFSSQSCGYAFPVLEALTA